MIFRCYVCNRDKIIFLQCILILKVGGLNFEWFKYNCTCKSSILFLFKVLINYIYKKIVSFFTFRLSK